MLRKKQHICVLHGLIYLLYPPLHKRYWVLYKETIKMYAEHIMAVLFAYTGTTPPVFNSLLCKALEDLP